MAEETKSDGWKPWVNAADIFNKLIVALVLGVATLYFSIGRDRFNIDNECAGKIQSLMGMVAGKGWDGATINAVVGALPAQCQRTEELNQTLIVLAQPAQGSVAKPLPTNPPPPDGTGGWVAVGFRGTTDVNFTTTAGALVSQAPARGAILKARWSVNIRSAAARWDDPRGILQTGQCFQVDDTRSLPAGDQIQIWASGHRVECPTS